MSTPAVEQLKRKKKRHGNCAAYKERRKSWMTGLGLEVLSEKPPAVLFNDAFERDSISSESETSDHDVSDLRGSVEHLVRGSSPFDHKDSMWNHGSCIWTIGQLKSAIEGLIQRGPDSIQQLENLVKSGSEHQWKNISPELYLPALLWASLDGNAGLVKFLIKASLTDVGQQRDPQGRTALHYAACSTNPESAECIDLLIQSGGSPTEVWDHEGQATPLICSAAVGNPSALASLLKHGAGVNAGLEDSRHPDASSALLWAVRGRNAECADLLLKHGAIVNGSRAYSEAPIHVAAAHGDAVTLKLLLDAKADTRVLVGTNRMSALHLAAEEGSIECLRLLLRAHADFNAPNLKKQTPLHLAALSQVSECVALLLDAGANPEARDVEQRTALHCAVVKSSRSTEILRLLIGAGADVNAQDQYGYSALHLAALNENSSVTSFLVSTGADLTARTKGGSSALAFVVRRTPDVLVTLQQRLDSAVALTEHDVMDVDCEARLDFRVLIPPTLKLGESALFTTLIGAGQRHMLQHPLCKAFLHLKWFKVRGLFLASLLFHAAFVIFLSAAVLSVYLRDPCPDLNPNRTSTDSTLGSSKCRYPLDVRVVGSLTIFLGICFAAKEVFQVVQSPLDYVRNWENWVQVSILVGLVLVSAISDGNPAPWQHHVAAVLIVLAWSELMMLVGRFPAFGLYVQMFQTVAVNIAKFLLAYLCLIIGFSFGMALLFRKSDSLAQVPASILTTLVMMTGELEYQDTFFNSNGTHKAVEYPGTTHVIFLAFLLFIVIVLMNLLVGLAVSDIQGLQKSAGLDRLVRQAKLVARMENIVFSSFLKILPGSVAKYLQNMVLLSSPPCRNGLPYHCAFTLRPHDPREDRMPADIKEGILKILLTKSAKSKRHSNPTRLACRTLSFIQDDANDDSLIDLTRQLSTQLTQLTIAACNMERRIFCLEQQWVKTVKRLEGVLENVPKPGASSLKTPDICVHEPDN